MTVRYYSSVAPPTTLSNGINSGAASIQVGSTSGFPSLTPYTLSLSYDTLGEELVQVNSVGGTTLSVARGIDGTSATSHNAGVEVRHVTSARDFADSRTHENSDQGIHGLDPTDELVGADKAQTLANKTLDMAEGTLNRVDIFSGGGWITTISGDAGSPSANVLQLKPTSSSANVWQVSATGQQLMRNTAANDANGNQYKFRITKADGTTDVVYILSGGSIKSSMANGYDGHIVEGSPDAVRRRAFAVVAPGGAVNRTALFTDGTASFTSSAANQRIMNLRMAAAQTANPLHIENSVGTEVANIDQSGAFNGRAVSVSDVVTSPAFSISGAPVRTSQAGSVLVSFTNESSWTQSVSFPQPFGYTPAVTTNINSGGGNTTRWGSRAISVGPNGFTLFLFRGDATDSVQTWVNQSVQWIAS